MENVLGLQEVQASGIELQGLDDMELLGSSCSYAGCCCCSTNSDTGCC
jgi:hypothetical protein